MAVHCGVCGTRITAAFENDGSFQTNQNFKGWDSDPKTSWSKIQDTCIDCATVLRKVVTDAANKIVAKHQAVVDLRRSELARYREQEAQDNRDEAEFRRAWAAKRALDGSK